MIRRREFITLLGGAAVWPRVVLPVQQSTKVELYARLGSWTEELAASIFVGSINAGFLQVQFVNIVI